MKQDEEALTTRHCRDLYHAKCKVRGNITLSAKNVKKVGDRPAQSLVLAPAFADICSHPSIEIESLRWLEMYFEST